MKSKQSSRRRFLKEGAALAGLAVGAVRSVSAEVATPDLPPARLKGTKYTTAYGERSRFEAEAVKRIDDYPDRPSPGKMLTPLGDSDGIITPNSMHFVADHYVPPDIDPKQHRLMIHGMVDRPMVFTLAELKRLPSVSGVYFVECLANSSIKDRGMTEIHQGIQEIHGRTSCAEWTGVPLSLLLQQAGVQKGASWLLSEGSDAGRWTYSLPLEKAMDDVLIAYAQNGEAIRPEQGYPLRLFVPGWEGPYSVKWLRRIKVVDQPYMSKAQAVLHAHLRPDLKGKSIWYQYEMPPKSVITRPAGGQTLAGPGFYEITGLAWSGAGVIRKVEVSTDGGKTWEAAKLQEPIYPKAHTRFRYNWNWNGEEVVIQSRCTDERGQVQPSLAELSKNWGVGVEHWLETPITPYQFNPIQPWKIARDGRIRNGILSDDLLARHAAAAGGADHTEH